MNPTYKSGDIVTMQAFKLNSNININDLVVFKNPFNKHEFLIKRVTKIKNQKLLFVEGDNIELSESFDSHNFGYIDKKKIIAIKKINNNYY
tara:strand:- start:75 stop:347 length:273 start_codon:yes stop_codon:yes gene_type:complete